MDCGDANTTTDFAQPFAFASINPLALHLNANTVPGGLDATTPLNAAVDEWNNTPNGTRLTLSTGGTNEATPSRNGTSTVGWVKIVPKNVLAATWTYVNDQTNRIIEADLFFNTTYTWTSFGNCPTTATGMFDVGDIATHELGHALGLSHVSDVGAQSTMYPSAPSDEIRKRTLTTGDVTALGISVNG